MQHCRAALECPCCSRGSHDFATQNLVQGQFDGTVSVPYRKKLLTPGYFRSTMSINGRAPKEDISVPVAACRSTVSLTELAPGKDKQTLILLCLGR